jgi:ankyrin repeat protein
VLACLSYLQSGCLEEANVVKSQYPSSSGRNVTIEKPQLLRPFVAYASMNWYVHVRKAAAASVDQSELCTAIDEFFASDSFDKWVALEGFGYENITPFHIAVDLGLYDYTKALISRPETNPSKGVHHKSPLYIAAEKGYHQIVEVLRQHGANLTEWDQDGYSPLHAATRNNHSKVTEHLLNSGADPFCTPIQTDQGYDYGLEPRGTPVSNACIYGHVETMSALLPFLESSEAILETLYLAVEKERIGLVRLLLPHCQGLVNTPVTWRLDIEDQRNLHCMGKENEGEARTLLYAACANRDPNVIKLLLEAGADPNTLMHDKSDRADVSGRGYSAIHALASSRPVHGSGVWGYWSTEEDAERTVEAFDLMIQAGANIHQVDPQGNTALFHAIDTVTTRILLEKGADTSLLNDKGETLLHCHLKADIIQALLEEGAVDTSQKSPKHGYTPLLSALAGGSVEKALLLLEFGADATGTDKEGNGAFHLAVSDRVGRSRQKEGLMRCLIEKLQAASGADVNARNKRGATALHTLEATHDFNDETFTALLDTGLDKEAKDNEGRTPLFNLILDIRYDHQRIALCKKMVEAGFRIDTKNGQGRSLLHVSSCGYHYVDFLRYLLQQGQDPLHTDNEGNTLWHNVAAKTNHRKTLHEELLRLPVDPRRPNKFRVTPLYIACSQRP